MTAKQFGQQILLLTCLILAGCMPAPPTVEPIPSLTYPNPSGRQGRCLIVLLHGKGGSHLDFDRNGFIEDARKARIDADLVAVNAHLGYYFERSVVNRLKEDVIEPARKKGYREIWLAGISMGGLGALLYAQQAGDVDGLFLMAPFLGNSGMIEMGGGLGVWEPGKAGLSDWQKDLWRYIEGFAPPGTNHPPLYLAYGESDPYAPTARVLRGVVPDDRVITSPGSHDWATWRPLWRRFLESAPLLHLER